MRDDLQLRSESNQPPSGIFMVASLATARNNVEVEYWWGR
jgi:hypothetical protein